MRALAFAIVLAFLLPAIAAAQGTGTPYDHAIRASAALELAAQQARAPSAARLVVTDDVLAPRRHGRKSEGTTLMIIGGAAVLVGAIVGNTGGAILIVGGLVCAGYGFYLYTE